MARAAVPESVTVFLRSTGLTIEQVASLSGIDKNHLVWAAEGRVSLDEAHILRLMETVPGLDTRGMVNSSIMETPLKRNLDARYIPQGTTLSLKRANEIKPGDFLRYTDPDGRRYWACVSEVPEEWEGTSMDVIAAGVAMTLDIRYPLWVASVGYTED